MRNPVIKYIAIAYTWTWGLWLSALLISWRYNTPLPTNSTILDVATTLQNQPFHHVLTRILFTLAVFGPVVGYVAMKKPRPFLGKPSWSALRLVSLITLAMLIPAIAASALALPVNSDLTITGALIAISAYFISNLLTSGTEEFGWRGYLYPKLKQSNHDFWQTSFIGGLIWAFWHLPLMIIIYWSLGPAMIGVLAGFGASIIAMNYITNVVYDKSNSIALAMLLHALNNTTTFSVTLIFPDTPFTILSAVAAWVIVAILEKKVVRPNTSLQPAQ